MHASGMYASCVHVYAQLQTNKDCLLWTHAFIILHMNNLSL